LNRILLDNNRWMVSLHQQENSIKVTLKGPNLHLGGKGKTEGTPKTDLEKRRKQRNRGSGRERPFSIKLDKKSEYNQRGGG